MTQIFKSYSDFLNRPGKGINGVSEDFAKDHPDFEKENKTNESCWNCSGCSDCFGCFDCSGCFGCFDCSGCFGCFNCFGCSGYSDCFGCFGLKNEKRELEIPIIKNIHQEVLRAIKKNGNKLDMGNWHTCSTTHCRAGWIEVLAGKEGKELAEKTNTAFAAMQIYLKSSAIKVSPVRFYESNELAMKDIIRCAEEESKGK